MLMHVSDACINAEHCLVPSKNIFFSIEIIVREVEFYSNLEENVDLKPLCP